MSDGVAPAHLAILVERDHDTGAKGEMTVVRSASRLALVAEVFYRAGCRQVSCFFPESSSEEPFQRALKSLAGGGVTLRFLRSDRMEPVEAPVLNIGFDYSEKEMLLELVRHFQGEQFLEETVSEYFSERNWTEPDLVILTGGSHTIGSALTWSIAYSELFFSSLPWLEFTPLEAERALTEFQQRKRRFGRL
ncbi:MAG: undecaprenyl diphosphate synthase family protein [Coprothermobacterota bacterium]|nr:undecaprenyl diphosphate synthase family protein [Coprothermobacterota bacterium]